jgi:hypothetical protein
VQPEGAQRARKRTEDNVTEDSPKYDTLVGLNAGAQAEIARSMGIPAELLGGATIQPGEVEYEWRVVCPTSTGNTIRVAGINSEALARDECDRRSKLGVQCWLERRPVGEWERVDG